MTTGRKPTGLVSLCRNSQNGRMFRFSTGLNTIINDLRRVQVSFDSESHEIIFRPAVHGDAAMIRLSNGGGSVSHIVNRPLLMKQLDLNPKFVGTLPTRIEGDSIIVSLNPALKKVA